MTRVAIAGAGLGGLCLAHGLRNHGFKVQVYERDAALAGRRQGYRLHLDSRAGLALERCLPHDLYQQFAATCGRPSTRFTVLSRKLRVLHDEGTETAGDPYAPATLATCADRQVLRDVLATGLEEHLVLGREVVAYEAGRDDVRVQFADGTEAAADILVGADGVGSAVRRQYLPEARIIDSGSRCIYGKTLLTDDVRALMPGSLEHGFTAVVGGRVGLALGLMQFRAPGAGSDYLMWAVSADRGRFPGKDEHLRELDAAALHEVALGMIRGWHPDVRGLLERADVDATFLVRIRTSEPVPAWEPTQVTVLGDAIHAMSPARGSGANTALQDAAALTYALRAPGSLTAGIARYETEMREYGYAAVAASREAEAGMGSRQGGVAAWLYQRLAR